jgi:hypothetical protein
MRRPERRNCAGAELLRQLAADARKLTGPTTRDALRYRLSLARWSGESEGPAEAIRHLTDLAAISASQRGDDDKLTIDIRRRLAEWTAKARSEQTLAE